LITATSWIASSSEGDYSVKHLGQTLLGIYALPFEVIGIALLISILGALLMAKKRNTDE
jgi:NADH:ubiquinone oxidoreductase subunit 6 (subunit J)